MNPLMTFLEQKLMPIAGAWGGQRHLLAIRTGIVATLPLTIVGSFFLIFINLPIPSYMEFIAPYRTLLDIPFRLTVGLMSLYCAFSIAFTLANSYEIDPISGGFLGILAFLCTTIDPVMSSGADLAAGKYINIATLGSANLFSSILCSVIAVEIYRFMKQKNINIKMPKGIPNSVADSFTVLFPAATVVILFWGIRHVLNIDVNSLITLMLSPLKSFLVGDNLFGGLLLVFIICLFWVIGIHGVAVIGPIIRPLWDTAIAENMEAFSQGISAHALPNLLSEQFFQWFVWIGGSGSTLPLALLFLFSRSKYLRQLGGISFIPGVFNINEPVIFGAPIVLNPILSIPFILTPMVLTTVTYIATKIHFVPMMMARLPFTLPSPIAAMISTNWSFNSFILALINLLIAFIIYYPFFKIFEKQALANEKGE